MGRTKYDHIKRLLLTTDYIKRISLYKLNKCNADKFRIFFVF